MCSVLELSSGLETTVNAAVTTYFELKEGTNINNATEANAQITRRSSGKSSGLYIRVITNTVTATSTLTSRKNAGAGAQTVSIGSSATGEFRDTTNTDTIAAADKFNARLVTGSTGTSMVITLIGHIFSADSGTVKKHGAKPSGTLNNASTLFQCLSNAGNSETTESNAQWKARCSCTAKNYLINVSANATTVATTFTFRKNTANGNMTMSVGAGATGIFEDTTHTDSIVSGDLINNQISPTNTGTGITFTALGPEIFHQDGFCHVIAGGKTSAVLGLSVTNYVAPGGTCNTAETTESRNQALAQVPYIASFMQITIETNTITATTTIRFRKNAGNGNQVISVGSSATGKFEDTTHTDTVLATDEINYQIVTGGTGTSIQPASFGHLATLDPLIGWMNNIDKVSEPWNALNKVEIVGY